MLTCTKCNFTKDNTEFRKDAHRKSGFRSRCRDCDSQYCKDRYKSKDQHKVIARTKFWRVEMRNRINTIKTDNPCCLCGEKVLSCIDFHHLESDDKDHSISKFKSWEVTLAEIRKCVALCANCHRKIHSGDLHIEFDDKHQLYIRDFEPFPSFKMER